jgi:hypothetical protein
MTKTKFLLTLLTVNSLLLAANSAFGDVKSTPASNIDITRLSHSITTIIDLEGDTRSLVEMAISRALVAQNTDLPNIRWNPTTVGHHINVPTPHVGKQYTPPPVDKDRDKSTTDAPSTTTVVKDKDGNLIERPRRFVMGARGDLLPQQTGDNTPLNT